MQLSLLISAILIFFIAAARLYGVLNKNFNDLTSVNLQSSVKVFVVKGKKSDLGFFSFHDYYLPLVLVSLAISFKLLQHV